MGFLDRTLSRFGYEKRSAEEPSWAALGATQGYATSLSARAAENLSTVLACTTAISSALAYVPALIYRRDEAANRIEQPSHPLARIVRNGANPQMTWPDFVEHLVASTLLHGNGLAEVVRRGNGQLAGFRWIPWQHVTVAELSSGRLAFDVNDGRGNGRRYLEGEVIHLKDRSDDGLVGRSRLSRAAEAVAGVAATQTFAKSFLENGAQPSGVIESGASMGPEAADRLQQDFERGHAGARRAGKTLILGGGLTWKSVSISPEDAELLESRKFGVIEICRLFQVPPPIVQAYENNTFTNSETAGRWFATFCLSPWARKLEAEFVRSALGTGLELELDLSGFLRGDPEKRWAAHEIALRNNVLTADEVRQIEGWNARPNMNEGGLNDDTNSRAT